MTISPSAEWQQIILMIAGAWLLFETWRGWQLGLIRGILRFLALIVAWFIGSATAATMSAALALFVHTPSPLIPAIIAAVIGLAVYLFIAFLSALLFKKTAHHRGFIRTFLGLGGALCGFLFGLFFLWGGISAVRSLGLLGEIRLMKAEQRGASPASDPLACNLVRLKKSLEMGALGGWFVQIDPFTTIFYETTRKSMMVLKDHDALMRFMSAPATQELLANPHLAHLLRDPQFQEAIATGNIFPLFQNSNVQQLFRDPQLIQQLKSFHLSETLDYALKVNH